MTVEKAKELGVHEELVRNAQEHAAAPAWDERE
jgi:hypothetical protein